MREGELIEFPAWRGMSQWSLSSGKRTFDCVCVLLSFPILLPLLLIVGAAVRLTSQGPVLFLQKRMGRHGKEFTILKFRTMLHNADRAHHPITTADNQRFTLIGPFLRRWKLDELPQLINVLIGDMSLVGPRPKLREHVISELPCRPGITGMATTVFAREETILARVPKDLLDSYFHNIVLPAKRELDAAYMARASFLSDLRMIVNSVLRRWDSSALESFIASEIIELHDERFQSLASAPHPISHRPKAHTTSRAVEAEHASAV